MQRRFRSTIGPLFAMLVAFAAFATFPGGGPVAADEAPLTVYAAASLREAFEAAAPAFTQKTGASVVFAYGGSDTLATQLLAGAPASVFASANEKQMKRVVDGGLAADAPATFARNSLVVVVPRANRAGVRSLVDLGRPGVAVVLAAATVPVGGYARAAFAKMSGRRGYGSDFASAVERNVRSNELDVKAVATKISLGEADAGVVYASDVTPEIASNVLVIALPKRATTDATYPIVALKSASNLAAARAFVDYMRGDGRRYLRARGFRAP